MVALTEGQKNAMSPEAAKFLENVKHPPFANMIAPYVTTPRRIPGMRETVKANSAPGEAALREAHKLKIKDVTIAGVPVFVIEPPVIRPEEKDKILFNIFGGAFALGSATDRAALTMAAELGIRVYSVGYTLAPEARYPVARDQCLAVYRELIKKGAPDGDGGPVDPANIYGMGSSAGAQLLVSMLLVARDEGLPMPTAGLYLCTPAVDLSGNGDSAVANADRDIMPVSMLLGIVNQNYLPQGLSTTDPYYSPMYAAFDTSFPRTVITTGTRDFALSNGVRFYWKLRQAGVEVELLVGESMWHGFNWDPNVPEALQARAAVLEFLQKKPRS